MDRVTISTDTEDRDLGIVFDEDLKFTSHVNQIVIKANALRLLYVTLVRPISDYSLTVWNPYFMKNINKLEAVQR